MAQSDGSVKLVVGLGNPGAEYAASRHNAGFLAVEKLLTELPPGRFSESHSAESRVFTGRFRGRNLILQMPLTYMNESGCAVGPLSRRLGIAPEEILVISDDMDLPLGRLRLRKGGADGGHNGLKSVIAHLGSANFLRLRIGIGHPAPGKVVDYVLTGFTGEEQQLFSGSIARAAEAVMTILSAGMTTAMNRFNAAPEPRAAAAE